LERRAFEYSTIKAWLKVCLTALWILISVNIVYMGSRIEIRVIFSSGATRVEGILQLVHSDLFGPMSIPSLGKSVYCVSFIDNFSRNTWIYFLRNKYEVFEKFKEFKALEENHTEKRITVLRTNNDGKFYGNEFE